MADESIFPVRFNLQKSSPPARAYVHSSMYENRSDFSAIKTAESQFSRDWDASRSRLKGADYVIAVLWRCRDEEEQIASTEFYAWNQKNWQGPLEHGSAWIFRNGIFIPDARIACLDSAAILYVEEMHRRKTKSREGFASHPPRIQGLKLNLEL